MKYKFSLLLILPLFLLAACGKPVPPAETPVKVKAVKAGSVATPGLFYSGVIEAEKNISLTFLSAGTVMEVSAREGDKVEKGQPLARLDCRSAENALQITREKAAQAEDAFSRFEPMYKNGNLPEIKMVEIRTGKTQAELAVSLAEKNAADCSLVSPETGLISERAVEPGDTAIPGKTVMKLVQVDKIYASIAVPEREIKAVNQGMDAEIEIDGRRLMGKVADVGVSANLLARTYTVRILAENSGLLPGMLCNVYLAQKNGGSLAVPATAVKLDEDGNQFVYVIDPGTKRAQKRVVQSSGFREGGILISSGLRAGEIVASEGVQKLDDGVLTQPEF